MKSYGQYLSSIFPDFKVQKISIDAGFTCPNRDGTISKGGCTYCRNDSFSPSYCNSSLSITRQLEEGKKFFARKYPLMKYLAYFQRYTGTYSETVNHLEKLYREALDVDDIVGLVIGTRPDCLSKEIISLLKTINTKNPVFIEIGAETSHNETLHFINRNHKWEDVVKAVDYTSKAGLHTGLHLICGLPGETEEMVLQTIYKTASLPIETLKIHHLQILYGTPLFYQWEKNELQLLDFTPENYLEICKKIIKIIPDNIVIERFLSQSPQQLVAYPKWGLKNYQFMTKLVSLNNTKMSL